MSVKLWALLGGVAGFVGFFIVTQNPVNSIGVGLLALIVVNYGLPLVRRRKHKQMDAGE